MNGRGLLLSLLLVACGSRPPSVAPAPTPALSPSPTATAEPTPAPTPVPTAVPRLDGDELAALVDPEALRAHLVALQHIADEHGGNRATGTAGFERSVDHVVAALSSAGYEPTEQPFVVDGVSSTNVIAERRGRGDGVIMIGAHLDSVPAGPGINDNGSGVAALLVIAAGLAELPPPERTIRIGFWGAEEGGPFGSRAYVERLSADERASIAAYLNLDMLGSPNTVRFVYDEDDAPPDSAALTERFASAIGAAGLAWDPIDVDRRSDHGPFAAGGIPIGGLFSGGRELVTDDQAARHGAVAGQPSDPCSDAACDTIDNVDVATLEGMSRIAALVLADLAADG